MGIGYVFESTDTGAPELLPVKGSFIDLLTAVLVDGYGTKSPLGWTKEFESENTNIAVFRNSEDDGTGFFLKVDNDWHDYAARFFAYEQMSDIDTGLLPFHYESSSSYHVLDTNSGSSNPAVSWKIFGDNRGIWICTKPLENYNITSLGQPIWRIMYFGDYIPFIPENKWPCCLLCATHSSTIGYGNNQVGDTSFSSAGEYFYRMARDINFEPGGVAGQLTSCSGIQNSQGLGYYDIGYYLSELDDPVQYTAKVLIHSANKYMGILPGVLDSITGSGINGVSCTGTTQAQKDVKIITYGDYKEYYMPYYSYTSGRHCYMVLTAGKGWRYELF